MITQEASVFSGISGRGASLFPVRERLRCNKYG